MGPILAVRMALTYDLKAFTNQTVCGCNITEKKIKELKQFFLQAKSKASKHAPAHSYKYLCCCC